MESDNDNNNNENNNNIENIIKQRYNLQIS